MNLKGIDLSSYQGKPDWNRIKVDFAIFRITERYGVDSSFEYNYQHCPYPKGGYKFSYAMSLTQIKQEAINVVNTLAGRPLQLPVFLDLEWNEQKALTKSTLFGMIEAFRKIIEGAGYKFGIYCNMDWYQNYIPEEAKKYDFWIASYPYNDDGSVQERLKPSAGIGWQYSSKGKVDGINGNVDMDIFYKDYSGKEQEKQETVIIDPGVTAEDVVNLARKYIGCNEADGSHRQIIDGYNSHRPWARNHMMSYVEPWCDTFVSFIYIKLNAVDLIGGTECGVEWHVKLFQKAGIWIEDGNITPLPGDIICYNWDDDTQPNDGYSDHIGIVESVSGKNITLIEGNYNNAVGRRTIPVGWGFIRGYARPKYGQSKTAVETPKHTDVIIDPDSGSDRPLLQAGDVNDYVKILQSLLNDNGASLLVDGDFGKLTLAAVIDFQRRHQIQVDGVVGPETWGELDGQVKIVKKSPGIIRSLPRKTGKEVKRLQAGAAVRVYEVVHNEAGHKWNRVDGGWIIDTNLK